MSTIETLQAELNTLRSNWKQSCRVVSLPAIVDGEKVASYYAPQLAEHEMPGYAEYRAAVTAIEAKIEGLRLSQQQAEQEKAKALHEKEAAAKAQAKAEAFLKEAESGLRIWSFPSLEEACSQLPEHVAVFASEAYNAARERNVRVITIHLDGEVWRSVDEAPAQEQPKPKAKAMSFGEEPKPNNPFGALAGLRK